MSASSATPPSGEGGDGFGPLPKKDVKLSDDFGMSPKTVKNMTVIGTEEFVSQSAMGPERRYVLVGTKEQWSTILEYTDSDEIFQTYVEGFLRASNDPTWIKKGNPTTARSAYAIKGFQDVETGAFRNPTEAEKLEFLKALYGIEIGNVGLDLLNTVTEEGFFGDSFDISSPVLAEFIRKHQPLLIQYVSSKKSDSKIPKGGISVLADQGTRDAWRPHVVHAMVQSAFATASAATKLVFAAALVPDEQVDIIELIDASTMVKNAAIVIKNALDTYGDRIQSIKEGAGSVFDEAWALIPVPDLPGIGIVVDGLKGEVKGRFISGVAGLGSADDMREDMKSAFADLLKGQVYDLSAQKGLKFDRRYVASTFDTLSNNFDTHVD